MCFAKANLDGDPSHNEAECAKLDAGYVAFMSQPLSQEVMDGLTDELGMPDEVWTPSHVNMVLTHRTQ